MKIKTQFRLHWELFAQFTTKLCISLALSFFMFVYALNPVKCTIKLNACLLPFAFAKIYINIMLRKMGKRSLRTGHSRSFSDLAKIIVRILFFLEKNVFIDVIRFCFIILTFNHILEKKWKSRKMHWFYLIIIIKTIR